MELKLEAMKGMSPLEAIPIIYQEQIQEEFLSHQEAEKFGGISGIMELCCPICSEENSKKIVSLLKLDGQVHPLFFHYLQRDFNMKLAQLSGGVLYGNLK